MSSKSTNAIAVYCGSSLGKQTAYHWAAESLGFALAAAGRPLVYGGGSQGIMGIVSDAVIAGGGSVTGVIPGAMLRAGGEGERVKSKGGPDRHVQLGGEGRESVETIVVESMHERKVEMAQRSCGFVGLPGGFGTFEEVLEVATWTQIGLHVKPVIVANVLSFYEPLRQLIHNGIEAGFIQPRNASLIIFVDGPADHSEHETFGWGKAVLDTLENWDESNTYTLGFRWDTPSLKAT